MGASILKRGQEHGQLTVHLHNLRDYTHDKRRTVDDRPYGGGPGMVMKPGPIFEAVDAIIGSRRDGGGNRRQIILMSPQGERLTCALAKELARVGQLIIICGHYEGIDERVRLGRVDRSISIGDYVLTGGELPAMVLIDCVARFVPGVLGHASATEEESFASGWLEYPQYTRPPEFRGMVVPDVLRSGDHDKVARWRARQARARTTALRPDLVAARPSSAPGSRRSATQGRTGDPLRRGRTNATSSPRDTRTRQSGHQPRQATSVMR